MAERGGVPANVQSPAVQQEAEKVLTVKEGKDVL